MRQGAGWSRKEEKRLAGPGDVEGAQVGQQVQDAVHAGRAAQRRSRCRLGCSDIWKNLLKSIMHEEASRCSSLDDKARFYFGTQHEILRIVDSDGVGEDAHKKEDRTVWAKETAR